MAWPTDLERNWQLLLGELGEAERGLFLIEYDRRFTRDAILRRLQADFERRGWELLKFSFSAAHPVAQLENALQERPAQAALVRLDDAAEKQFSALNLARERLYALPAAVIFLISQETHTRLLQSAHDLATWIAPPFRFALPETGLPHLPAPADNAAPDLAAQIEYYREQIQRAIDEGDLTRAFDLLPPLADLYLSAEMYDAALLFYRALARRHEDEADEQQAILFTRRGDAAQGWRALTDLQAGRLSADDRLFLQRLLAAGLFAVRETPAGAVIADEMGREKPLPPNLLLALRALSESVTTESYSSADLARLLRTRFDREELRTLCFELGVDYDALPAEGKAGKARELVGHMERRDRIPDLVEAVRRARPDIRLDEALAGPPPQAAAGRAQGGVTITGDGNVIGDGNVVSIISSAAGAPPRQRDAGRQRVLKMARRTLAVLEEQAAGYTALTIPAHLKIELEEKRRQVAELEKPDFF